MKENMINRPLMLLVGLIVIFMVAVMFISCSEKPAPPPPPKYDASLDKPDIQFRLGHTYEQIQYWEDRNADLIKLEMTDTSLVYEGVGENPAKISYIFKDNKCWLTSIALHSYSKKQTFRMKKEFDELVGDFGFVRANDEFLTLEDGVMYTFKHKTMSNLQGLMWIVQSKSTRSMVHIFQIVKSDRSS